MTRKDYILIASALREARLSDDEATQETDEQWTRVVNRVARALANDNPSFDRARFVAACMKEA